MSDIPVWHDVSSCPQRQRQQQRVAGDADDTWLIRIEALGPALSRER
jgi:hypothetical protein